MHRYVCKMVNMLYRSPCRGSHPKAILGSFCDAKKLGLCYGCSNLNHSESGGGGIADSSTWASRNFDVQSTPIANSSWSALPSPYSYSESTASATVSPNSLSSIVNCSAPFQKYHQKLRSTKALANLWLEPRVTQNLLSAYTEFGWRAPVVRQGVERLLAGHAAAVDECDAESDEHKTPSPLGRVQNYEVLADLSTSFSLLLSFMFVALSGMLREILREVKRYTCS